MLFFVGVPTVTSRQNAIVARFRAASRREATDVLLLDGTHLVAEALDAGLALREAAVASDASAEVMALVARLQRLGVPVAIASSSVMSALSPVRSPSPIAAIAARPAVTSQGIYDGSSLVVMAIDIQDPGNLGALVRVAEAGGAAGVVCAGACADPFGWKAIRGSMGSMLRLPIVTGGASLDAIEDARHHGCRIVATVPRDGVSLFDVDLTGLAAVLIGGEGEGLTASHIAAADERVTIPMEVPVESLNASVAAAVVIYEARRQRRATR